MDIQQIKVPIDFQITETSRALVKRLIAETVREALQDEKIAFLPNEDELRTFIRTEVRTLLAEQAAGQRLASGRKGWMHGNHAL